MPTINQKAYTGNTQVKKTQYIRMMDVAVFGPLMIYTALGKTPPQIVKNSMVLIGIGTILYNGYNYLEQERKNNGHK